ncbi:MAG: DUF192 domain-containing protein [Candidatus Brocadiae bacterium]|nr:DUF192 domain-containing protein [Candidatus Brocadiia bacterium]
MNWKKHILPFVVIFLLVGLLSGGRGACTPDRANRPARPPDARVEELTLEGRPGHLPPRSYTIRAEIADTVQKRRQGLADRPGLEAGYAMLYVYDTPQRPEFSEGSTSFPLSLAFIKEDGTIAEIHKTKANDPRAIAPEEPVRYVLEVRSGWFEDRKVGVGARFVLPPALQGPPPGPQEPTADGQP